MLISPLVRLSIRPITAVFPSVDELGRFVRRATPATASQTHSFSSVVFGVHRKLGRIAP